MALTGIFKIKLVVLLLDSILPIFLIHKFQAKCFWVAWFEFFCLRWYGAYCTLVRWYYTPKLLDLCFLLVIFEGLKCAWTFVTLSDLLVTLANEIKRYFQSYNCWEFTECFLSCSPWYMMILCTGFSKGCWLWHSSAFSRKKGILGRSRTTQFWALATSSGPHYPFLL